jgi:glutamate/tyrosine decarboxylase-like PLP-dependent enzyme
LGGKKAIKRILIGTPTMNADQIKFSEELVRKRINESVSIDSKKDKWHYAPYSMGTIYWTDGRKQNFTMYLSGFSIGGHLFAILEQPNK